MIVSRTPLRVSFFGGGTDYPEWFQNGRPGAVLGMAINKYVYITAMPLSPLHPYKFRLYWSKIERCHELDEIQHPVVRETLRSKGFYAPYGYSIIADLPARNGLASSSAFAVGFLHLTSVIRGYNTTPELLAMQAIHIERDILKEAGGWQDQFHCAFGGVNRFDFKGNGVDVTHDAFYKDWMETCFFLLYVGDARNSWEVNAEQIENTKGGRLDEELDATYCLVDEATDCLRYGGEQSIHEFGRLLHEGWMLKRQFSSRVSTPKVDELYALARQHGAIGGKLCGAGGGGFLLLLVPPENQARFRRWGCPKTHPIIPVGVDGQGSAIVLR